MSADKRYMHPRALRAFEAAEAESRLTLRAVQTQGNAAASAGTHASDGTYTDANGSAQSYCAAVDISIRTLKDEAHIRWVLYCLAKHGFVAWYRHTGSFKDNRHIHAVYAGVKMKPMLQAQVKDFLADRTGLVGHQHETFWTASADVDNAIRAAFIAAGNH